MKESICSTIIAINNDTYKGKKKRALIGHGKWVQKAIKFNLIIKIIHNSILRMIINDPKKLPSISSKSSYQATCLLLIKTKLQSPDFITAADKAPVGAVEDVSLVAISYSADRSIVGSITRKENQQC